MGDVLDILRRRQQQALPFDSRSAYLLRDAGENREPMLGSVNLKGVMPGADPTAMSVPVLISTTLQDRYGDIILSEGCQADEYAANPVVLLNHCSYGPSGLPIGKAKNALGELQIKVEERQVTGRTFFAQSYELAVQVYHLCAEGVMPGISVGFNPIRSEIEEMYSDDKPPRFLGLLFKKWKLLEYSHVTIPANPECVTLALERRIDGRPMLPELVRALAPFAAPKLPWSKGWTADRVRVKDDEGHEHDDDGKFTGPGGGGSGKPDDKTGNSETGDKDKKGEAVKARVPEQKLSEKAQRAKDNHKLVDKDIQRYSEEHNEPAFAKAVGGVSFPDGEPIDVAIAGPSGKVGHGIELKTMVDNTNNKITMKRSAMERKAEWEKKNNVPIHTVVLDDQAVKDADGPGKHDLSKRRIFYRRGYGSFRVQTMHEVKDMKELKELMKMKESKLPAAAKRPKGQTQGDLGKSFVLVGAA